MSRSTSGSASMTRSVRLSICRHAALHCRPCPTQRATLRAVSPHCPTVAHTVPHCLFYDEFSPADMEEHHGAVPHVPVRGVVDEADASFKAFKQKGMDPAEINRIVLDSCSALGMPPTLACITLWSEYMESEPLAVFFRLLQQPLQGFP